MIHRPRGHARKRCLVWSWESPLVGGGWIDFRALHARPVEGRQRLCKLRLCLEGIGASDGTPAFALFHSRSRGRKLLDRGGAALAHRAALVEPADSRSGVGGWCEATGAESAQRCADRGRQGLSGSRAVGAIAGRGGGRRRSTGRTTREAGVRNRFSRRAGGRVATHALRIIREEAPGVDGAQLYST